ncbi:MAG: sulfite exporter TauE/SafE family protein [Alphaproteobacteria bacterium]|nr:MAG: sulfite exporter TauE/SafE family protein [Alphaproteobacteria bacterium]
MDFPTLVALGAAVFVLAGTIKGLVGLGLPTTFIGVMSQVTDPRTAIALGLVPMIVTNGWQAARQGQILATLRSYAPFIAALMLFGGVTAAMAVSASDRFIHGVMGLVIVLFVAVNATLRVPPLPARWDRPAQIVAGVMAGVMGGITSVWAPPMAVYLAARHTPPEEFVRATGVMIFFGALPLAAAYAQAGMFDARLGLASAVLVLPALAGFSLGERLRRRLSAARFRTVLLAVFLAMGLNLIRKALA